MGIKLLVYSLIFLGEGFLLAREPSPTIGILTSWSMTRSTEISWVASTGTARVRPSQENKDDEYNLVPRVVYPEKGVEQTGE